MTSHLKKNDPEKARQYFADKLAFTTGPVELSRSLKNNTGLTVIDVRESDDYAKGHIPGDINLPHDKWDTLQGLKKDAVNVLYCYSQVCHLGATAAVQFAGKGYPVMELEGGFDGWQEHGLEIEKAETSQKGRHLSESAPVGR